jgi:hypothetical protein
MFPFIENVIIYNHFSNKLKSQIISFINANFLLVLSWKQMVHWSLDPTIELEVRKPFSGPIV